MSRALIAPRGAGSPVMPRAVRHLRTRRSFDVSSEWFAGAATLALASNALIGFIGMVMFIGCAGLIILRDPMYNMRQLLRFAPLMALPFLAILSTIWSDAPPRTMRAGLELLLTFVAAIAIARNLRRERMIMALFAAFMMLALSTMTDWQVALATKGPLVAGLGSKNQVGFTGYALFATSIVILADGRQPLLLRAVALPCIALGLFVGYLAQSGGTTAAAILFLLIFPPLAILSALKLPWRIGVTALALLIAGIASFFLNELSAQLDAFRTTVLNKDATLTGRTYLWEVAGRLSERRPYLGYGYSSFWRQGNIEAEGLWRWAGIASRSGFNFHNLLIGMRVDLGYIGVAILVATCAIVLIVALGRQLFQPSVAMAGLIGLMVNLYIRSYVEEGLVAPFSLPTLIWLAAVVYAAAADTPGVRRAEAPARGEPASARQWVGKRMFLSSPTD